MDLPSYCACCGWVLAYYDERYGRGRCGVCQDHDPRPCCGLCPVQCRCRVICETCGRHPSSPGMGECGVCALYGPP